jgi:hypothetical protein
MKVLGKKRLLNMSTSTNITSIGELGDKSGIVVGDVIGPILLF